ncbi:MAG TPA: hypothetical protein VJ063_03360 [Verrucomicrobiae bacterium]|nr:hypothetical protein [Verrucomicrobiae bacterium]
MATETARVPSGLALILAVAGWACSAHGQIDPAKRELIQLGYNQPIQGKGPLSGYAFYYLNLPEFLETNLTLRLAVAPVYLDTELGIRQVFGPHTDIGLGLHGGGFADSYAEIRHGKFRESESFTGHGGGVSASLYHLFNPGRMIPLSGVFRVENHYSVYARDDKTADTFEVPDDRSTWNFRTGLRWGGIEPTMSPEFGLELSAWYEAQARTDSGRYGFNGDRRVEPLSHLYWARALISYTFTNWAHHLAISMTIGGTSEADRFSAYRLGGLLPLAAEFPLSLPGYYFQEISAKRFALLGANYLLPLDPESKWALSFVAAGAVTEYLEGLQQPGSWHSGVGAGIRWRPTKTWQMSVAYAYGVDALRNGDRGAHSIGFLMQWDLEAAGRGLFEPGEYPIRSRGLQRLLNFGQ